MRDFVNPALFVLVVVLVLCGTSVEDPDIAANLTLWTMVVCGTAFFVDLGLGLARSLTHRPALDKVAWGMFFLLVFSSVFVVSRKMEDPDDPAIQEFHQMLDEYRETGDANLTNRAGDTLLVVAAALGKTRVVGEMLEQDPPRQMLSRAIQRAAEAGHLHVVKLLLPHVDVNEVSEGTTPLNTAAASGRYKVVEYLLENGADPDLKDESGTPPIIHAVKYAKSVPTVEVLLKHNADTDATDADGRKAANYSDHEKIDALLGR